MESMKGECEKAEKGMYKLTRKDVERRIFRPGLGLNEETKRSPQCTVLF